MKRIGWTAALIAVAFAAGARAEARLGLGIDYLFNDRAAFRIDLQGDVPLGAGGGRRASPRLALTGRAGGLLTASPTIGAAPLDVGLRLGLGRVYVEGLAGPWIFFSGDALRAHGAIGFGVTTPEIAAGLELGGLTGTSGLIGARLAFRL